MKNTDKDQIKALTEANKSLQKRELQQSETFNNCLRDRDQQILSLKADQQKFKAFATDVYCWLVDRADNSKAESLRQMNLNPAHGLSLFRKYFLV